MLVSELSDEELKGLIENDKATDLNIAKSSQNNLTFYLEDVDSKNEARGGDFSKWVKEWMGEKNVTKFDKFLRFPLKTSTIISEDVVPKLEKVFYSSNRASKIQLNNSNQTKDAKDLVIDLEVDKFFKSEVWNSYIYRHNSLVVVDADEEGNPYPFVLDIENVVNVVFDDRLEVKTLVFKTNKPRTFNDKPYKSESLFYIYTDEEYSVVSREGQSTTVVFSEKHNIGECPAVFVSQELKNRKSKITRKSVLGLKTDYEFLTLYDTLWRYTQPHGGFPIAAQYKQNQKACGTQFSDVTKCVEGWIVTRDTKNEKFEFNGSASNLSTPCPKCHEGNIIQTMTNVRFPVPEFGDQQNAKPFDLNQNFIKFHIAGKDDLIRIDDTRKKLVDGIIVTLVGSKEETNAQAKNELQVRNSLNSLENNLSAISNDLSVVRTKVEGFIIKKKYGKEAVVTVHYSYGSIFYLQTEEELNKLHTEADNPIERAVLQDRLIEQRNQGNPDGATREKLLYRLMPYNSLTNKEFGELQAVDTITRELRLNYNNYISELEESLGTSIENYFNNFFPESKSIKDRVIQMQEWLNELVKAKILTGKKDETGTALQILSTLSPLLANKLIELLDEDAKDQVLSELTNKSETEKQ